jgi:hypothetical protein
MGKNWELSTKCAKSPTLIQLIIFSTWSHSSSDPIKKICVNDSTKKKLQ